MNNTKICDMEKFNLKKLSDVEVGE